MGNKRYKFSRYAMYTKIQKFFDVYKPNVTNCLLVGDSLKGKGDDSIVIRNTAITNMLPAKCKILAPSYPDVDIQDMPYVDNTFDCVIADQVLEHVRKPWIGVEEVRRVLKPKGLAILTSALMFPIHSVPDDYWRFTPNGLMVLCEKFSTIYECDGTGDLEFAMTCFKGRGKRSVVPGSELEKKALACDKKHLVSVWIIGEK